MKFDKKESFFFRSLLRNMFAGVTTNTVWKLAMEYSRSRRDQNLAKRKNGVIGFCAVSSRNHFFLRKKEPT